MRRTDPPKPRLVEPRRWTALGSLAATGLIVAAPLAADTPAAPHDADHAPFVLAQGGEGGEGGEGGAGGEGGEGGEGGGNANPDVAYLTGLGLIAGHLRSGITLYEDGHAEMAATHMKHPAEEIYSDLAPKLDERGAAGFADELERLAQAVEGGALPEEARAAYDAVTAAIAEAAEAGGGGTAARLQSAVALTRVAAEEYAIGVQEGTITNLHEYQDAWGFIAVARDDLTALAAADAAAVADAATEMLDHLAATEAVFPELAPEGTVDGDASVIHGAAARMELAAVAAG